MMHKDEIFASCLDLLQASVEKLRMVGFIWSFFLNERENCYGMSAGIFFVEEKNG